MEPLHVTEFASKRYYEKLEQLPRDHEQQQNDRRTDGASARFILPLRQAEQQGHEPPPRHVEYLRLEKEKEKDKRGLFGRLRSSRPNISAADVQPPTRPSFVSVAPQKGSLVETATHKCASPQFDELFFDLPNELKIQIIASLPLSDVLNLRLASRSWHRMVSLNEVPIVRYHLQHEVPVYAQRLYPISDASGYSLHYLCGLWHRLHVAAKLARRMCDWCTKEIFLKTTKEQVASFAGQRERMYRRLIPLLFTVFHFFENYRKLHLQYIQEHGYGVERTPYTVNPIEVKIMEMYDDRTLLQVHQIFPMMVASFGRRLRPPSYVGRLEKTIRGYLREEPGDDIKTAVLCVGGLRQVLRCWEVNGYNTRVGIVESWIHDIKSAKEPPRPIEASSSTKDAKAKRSLMSLGRKKSTWQIRESAKMDDAAGSGRGSLERTPSRSSTSGGCSPNLVFNTSLAAGMPMGRLDHDQYQMLLADLPVLQRLWLATAEAMILDRGIVERSVDIKRNAQVLMDLIKEDGIIEEDIWWYGMAHTESIRPPPLEAIEEDPIE